MIVSKKNKVNPFFVLLGSWFAVSVLYFIGLSDRLYYEVAEVLPVVFSILIMFAFGWFCFFWLGKKKYNSFDLVYAVEQADSERKKIYLLWFILLAITLLDFVYSGYVPFFRLVFGGFVSHFSFGIPTVHGLVIAGHLFFSLLGVFLYIRTKRKIYLLFFIIAFIIGVLVVSRKVFMVASVEATIIVLMLSKITISRLFKVIASSIIVILIFGALGNLRSGNDVIDRYGGMNAVFSNQLAGFGWTYLYLTTPTHNLIYAVNNFEGESNYTFSNTTENLLPSVIRKFINGSSGNAADRFAIKAEKRYWLESSVFNVATSFIEPYIDLGRVGMLMFAFFIGSFSSIIYRLSHGVNWIICNGVLCAAAFLSIYSNNYSNLNFLGQFIWVYLFNFFVLRGKT